MAEIGLQEYGWIPFDPTPGGAPDRAESRIPMRLRMPPALARETARRRAAWHRTEYRRKRSGPGTGTGESSLLGEQAPEFLEETALQNLADALDPSVRKDTAEILGRSGATRLWRVWPMPCSTTPTSQSERPP